ncbi:MAG TPA: IclR family transcriptional regulator [Candidatus Acidoferrales bacterium]|nr:IclR family transcriptional regulator [Candidatus Acidoferrales bacterium]
MKTATSVRRRRPKSDNNPGHIKEQGSDQYISKAVSRAIDVLDCFADGSTALSLKEISNRTEMPETSLFRVLATLDSRGYLCQNADGSYRLTPKLLHGKLRERADRIRDAIHPRLQALSRQFDETASVAFLFEDHIAVLASIESFHDIRAINKIGRVLPPYASSMGKAITAFQDCSITNTILEVYGLIKRTNRTVTDRDAIYAEFKHIRQLGYSCDRGEAMEGGVCVGAPIMLPNGKVDLAASVSVPMIRMDETREQNIIAGLLAATHDMAEILKKV